jgi:uncharacterized membrane protein
MKSPGNGGILLAATILMVCAGHATAQSYSAHDLGNGAANGINDAGQIVGAVNGRAVIWTGTTETPLGTLGLFDSAKAINDSGVAVGFDLTYSSGRHTSTLNYNPVAWNQTSPTQLEHVVSGVATGVNNSGQISGAEYWHGNGQRLEAVIWDGSQTTALGSLYRHTSSVATDLNDNGQAVGYFFRNDDFAARQAVLWNGTTPTQLGTVANSRDSIATAINDHGQEVGYADGSGHTGRSAVLWNGTKPTVLGTLGGTNSEALALNNAGMAVGYSYLDGNTVKQAVLWENGQVINLNSDLTRTEIKDGWVLESANGINNNGTIVGDAVNTFTGKDFAFVLDVVAPVPELSRATMMAFGLALIGFTTLRRRKNSLN